LIFSARLPGEQDRIEPLPAPWRTAARPRSGWPGSQPRCTACTPAYWSFQN